MRKMATSSENNISHPTLRIIRFLTGYVRNEQLFKGYFCKKYLFVSQGNEYKTEQGKRTRLDIEMRRREVELDHDYWKPGSRSRKPEGGQKPVSREWNRLLNAEEETQPLRSIRF